MKGRTTVTMMEMFEMSTIPVDLPDDLRLFVEAKVQRGQFASANDYIVALVDAARSKKTEIEVALLEGLQSGPAEEWTIDEWSDIRQRVTERHQKGE